MILYNVHLYRKIRLTFQRIEAETPGIEAETPEAAAAIACDRTISDADDIDDCDGENFAAIVDVVGDDNFGQSKTINFEADRQRCRRIARVLRHGQGSPSENLIDLLADARHWCDDNAEDFGKLDRQAYRHYLAELDASRKES